jgi:hypothetical protein
MKVNDPNLSALASTGAAGIPGPSRTSPGSGAGVSGAGDAATSDGVHLSELVRSLRSLAADSPEHQARLEHIARSVGGGSYHVDAPGTASKIVDDAIQRR